MNFVTIFIPADNIYSIITCNLDLKSYLINNFAKINFNPFMVIITFLFESRLENP